MTNISKDIMYGNRWRILLYDGVQRVQRKSVNGWVNRQVQDTLSLRVSNIERTQRYHLLKDIETRIIRGTVT